MSEFDHFVLAAPDLDQAKSDFEIATGCHPKDGGAHVGLGTRNALASFGADSYLEIIAPDPAQPQTNNMGTRLSQLGGLTPLHWAVRSSDLPGIAERANALGFEPGPILDTSRQQPNGERLAWQLMGIRGNHPYGGLVPFYIDWLDCPHPATTNPTAGAISQFEIHLPPGPVHELLAGIRGVRILEGEPALHFQFETPNGTVAYTGNQLAGFTL